MTYISRMPPFAAIIAVSLLAGCHDGQVPTPPPPPVSATSAECDDTVHPTADLPQPLRDAGIEAAFGADDVWFIAPSAGATWSTGVAPIDGGFGIKRPVWTTRRNPPTVTVERIGDGAKGSAALAPTGEGLPGPVPMTLTFPAGGRWKITARGETGTAEIFITF